MMVFFQKMVACYRKMDVSRCRSVVFRYRSVLSSAIGRLFSGVGWLSYAIGRLSSAIGWLFSAVSRLFSIVGWLP